MLGHTPRRFGVFALCLLLLLAAPLLLSTPAWADEEKEESAEGAEGELMQATDEQAKTIVAGLKKAAKKKKLADARPLVEAIDGFKHESFTKPLLKLMTNKLGVVAKLATDALALRCTEKKVLAKIWKNAFSNKVNDKRYAVRARVVRLFGEQGIVLDAKKYKEVERDWRWMFGNPQIHFDQPALDLVVYFALTKDKRHCRWLAEQLDEPIPANPNSPSNPPAEWWERRYKMWQPVKPEVVDALLEITGQEFDTSEEAKAWFEANKKTFKFDW